MNPDDNQDDRDKDQNGPQIIDVAPPSQVGDSTVGHSQNNDVTPSQTFEPTEPASDAIDVSEPADDYKVTPMVGSESEPAPVDTPAQEDSPATTNGIFVNSDEASVDSNNESIPEDEHSVEDTVPSPILPPSDTVVPPPPQVDEPQATTDDGTSVSADGMAVAGAAAAVAATQAPKSKHKVSIIPIIVAMLVAIVLAGLTVFAYQKQQTEKKQTNIAPTTQQNTSESTKATTPATTSDVDEAANAANEALTSDDAADTNNDELNDATLGL